jgi:copper homeostasis protein
MTDCLVVEICADSVESALAAQRGGAHRIELCSNLLEGGVTPSAGLISTVRKQLAIDLSVMIRPRGGDFCYSPDEFETMKQDVRTAKQLGADGVVLGILRVNGHVDVDRTRRLIDLARPLKVTFHRAFDMSCDLDGSLEEVIRTAADRLLTSGGKQKVEDGIGTVRRLQQRARNHIAMMVVGGINESNIHRILAETGVTEIHASARTTMPSAMKHRNEEISMGAIKGHEYQRLVVLEERVRRLLAAAGDGIRLRSKAESTS